MTAGPLIFASTLAGRAQGGCVKAGAWSTPFGSSGGKLEIGLWGDDPTQQGQHQTTSERGIYCIGKEGNADGQCYDLR